MLICGHGSSTTRSFAMITYEETLGVHYNITLATSLFNTLAASDYQAITVQSTSTPVSNYAF